VFNNMQLRMHFSTSTYSTCVAFILRCFNGSSWWHY